MNDQKKILYDAFTVGDIQNPTTLFTVALKSTMLDEFSKGRYEAIMELIKGL